MSLLWSHLVSLAVASAVVTACTLTSDLGRLNRETDTVDASVETDGGVGRDASADGSSTGDCPSDMVTIARAGGGSFCIDAYEVSVDAYRAFVASAQPSSQTSICTWNTTFEPSRAPQGCEAYDLATAVQDRPVACIDWCDALAFCTSAGKRLCGSTDPTRPTNPFGEGDHRESEWFVACSANGTKVYPYGDSFELDRCIVRSSAPQSPSAATCEGGEPGLHHMSGNVSEWDNTCDSGPEPRADGCRARGGAFWAANDPAQPALVRCDAAQGGRRDAAYSDRGFRCCKSP